MRNRPQTQLGLLDGLAAQLAGNEFLERLGRLVDREPFRRELEALRDTLVRKAGREVGPSEAIEALVAEVMKRQTDGLRNLADGLSRVAVRQQPEAADEFYRGLHLGHGSILDAQGNFAGQPLRTHTYIELLTLWPAIEQLRHRQPPITRGELYEWLKCQDVWASPPGLDSFHDLCDEIRLGTKRRGRPRQQN